MTKKQRSAAASRKWYRKNRQRAINSATRYYKENKAAVYAQRAVRYRQMVDWYDTLRSGPCTDCGYTYPPECMDFDHVRGRKRFSLSHRLSRSKKTILREMEKCELVCSNCHRVRTRRRTRGEGKRGR